MTRWRRRYHKLAGQILLIESKPKKRQSESTVMWSAKLRYGALIAYGGKCACCGETNPAFLELDHIKGDGAERRRLKEPTGIDLCRVLCRTGYKDVGLQVLCSNCNSAKGRYGYCPHKGPGSLEPNPFLVAIQKVAAESNGKIPDDLQEKPPW